MKISSVIKIVAGVLIVVGLGFSFIERRYQPQVLVNEQSVILPSWVGWTGFLLSGLAALAYFAADIFEWWRGRSRRP